MQGEGVENKEFLASFQKETFHKVGLINVGASLRHLRQVPSGNRRLTPHALAGIEHAVPLENAVNGCYRGNIGLALFEEIEHEWLPPRTRPGRRVASRNDAHPVCLARYRQPSCWEPDGAYANHLPSRYVRVPFRARVLPSVARLPHSRRTVGRLHAETVLNAPRQPCLCGA